MKKLHLISSDKLDAKFFAELLSGIQLELSTESREKIKNCRKWLDQKLANSNEPVYGINTGFGSLYDKQIPKDQLEDLQVNLMVSHACGTGARVPDEIVRIMLFLKIQSLSYGYSGITDKTAEYLIQFFNNGIAPHVFEFGSLGASGDLAPLAHLCLPLLGKGSASWNGKHFDGMELLEVLKLPPLRLQSKEGLALLNGTQFMSAYGIWNLVHAKRLIQMANTISALSLEAFDGRADAFDARVHQIRPHAGQLATAEQVRNLLKDSPMQAKPKKHVQDPYSFRCIPQVHGASADTINYVEKILLTEINSTTDNPNIFHQDDTVISGGNFHGQPLALAMDFLAIALAELGSISERRTYQLISGARQLPSYLVQKSGINSGMMILQYTAAGIVSRNKQLCTPASVDSIVSSNGQEDHVSMGANAASRTRHVVENLYSILAIELLVAVQAMEFRRPLKTSPPLESLIHNFRQHISFLDTDRVLHNDMKAAEAFLKNQLINL